MTDNRRLQRPAARADAFGGVLREVLGDLADPAVLLGRQLSCFLLSWFLLTSALGASVHATERARDLGVPFAGETGRHNAITDVAGVEVGHTTIIEGSGELRRGEGPIRTGVTAIHPRGKNSISPVFGGWFTLNASGEMTGTTWLDERGLIDGPILITNTHSVGVARDAAVAWMVDRGWPADWHAPIAAETYDGVLNDINGFHVTRDHALAAMQSASGGPVLEGAVGGGTGMICNRFKGGIGTSSRVVSYEGLSYTVGVLVQCNYGARDHLKQIAGVSVTELHEVLLPCVRADLASGVWPSCDERAAAELASGSRDGSIIVVVATDAPLLPHQLKRIAKRPSLAIGRLGAISGDGSGDIFVAFSTAAKDVLDENSLSQGLSMFPNNHLSLVFEATVEATEEAIVNAMVAADTMEGANGYTVFGLPEERLRAIMERARKQD
ncbi:MAG: P1 family peptidase [Pseudomonadota bacterium]